MYLVIFNSIAAAFGLVMTDSFGEWSFLLQFLLFTMFAEYTTQAIVNLLKEKKGWRSFLDNRLFLKNVIVILFVIMAHNFDVLLGTKDAILTGCIYYYLSHGWILIVDNSAKAGVPIPPILLKAIDLLRTKKDDTNKNNNNLE
ncbi:phage holin family protein [Paenibacillus sp. N1-5-1-14]|uniref:phage holin family protein n=1 Tax=Paenibacillus radicibacter TaxID=2972488 RepID=UPI00215993DE|nr:phage holin family protein [Paenibacillus radicibacter]MCR8643688.1 phage holin family protein [Paenibacillus radicibacter]